MKRRRSWFQKRSGGRPIHSKAGGSKSRRAAFEPLESRWLLSSVGFSPIANVTLPAGTTVFVPLNANDPGKTVSFAATVSDYSKVTPVVMPQANKSLQLNINGISQPMVFQLFDNLVPTTASHIEGLVQSG